MVRSPNTTPHPKGWRFAGAARGYSFWQNGKQYRVTPASDPCNVVDTQPSIGLCLIRIAALNVAAKFPIVEVAK